MLEVLEKTRAMIEEYGTFPIFVSMRMLFRNTYESLSEDHPHAEQWRASVQLLDSFIDEMNKLYESAPELPEHDE